MFRNTCLEHAVSKQEFFTPSSDPLEAGPKENVNSFPFCFISGSPEKQRTGKPWPQYTKHDSSWCPSKGSIYFFFFLPTYHLLQMIKSQPQGKWHLKKIVCVGCSLREVDFSWKVNIPCQRGNKNKRGAGKDDIWIQTKVCLLLPPPPTPIIHWCAKKNSPNLAFHKPFGALHIYSLS